MKRASAFAVALSALALVAWRQHAGSGAQVASRWEYKLERITYSEIEGGKSGSKNFVSNLNRLGEESWELTAVHEVDWSTISFGANDQRIVEERSFDCYFKRPKSAALTDSGRGGIVSPGKWRITYHPNGVQRTYVVKANGDVTCPEEKLSGRIRNDGASLMLDFGDGKLERLTVAGSRLFVEHFSPKDAFPRIYQVGIGEPVVAR